MDLKIKDVAELLNVSETTIRRWLSDGKIPAYRLNHQFRFSREEIQNWVMSCKMGNADDSQDVQVLSEKIDIKDKKTKDLLANKIGSQAYSLFRAIYKGGLISGVEGNTKEQVISESVKIIAKNLSLDAQGLTELLMERENLMPTSLNHGIGVPHTRDFLLPKSHDVVIVVFPKNPIDYGAIDGQKVHTLFFLFACDDKRHLHLLAKLAHLTKNEQALSFFQTKPSQNEVLQYIKSWEAKLGIFACN
jgi:nitrogen PTS system EIIA component